MADYSINAIARKVSYTGSAGVGPYAFSFEVLDQTDVAVYKNATLLTLTTDYTVTINANGTGSVTLVVAATAADTIVILGARDIERTTDFVTAGDLRASSLNEQLDSLTIFDQQIDERVERSIKAPAYDPTGINMVLPSKADRADKLLKFDTEGNVEAAGALDVFGGALLGANYVSDAFTGNGSTTVYTLTTAPGSKLNTQVYIDGVYQEKSTYSLTGSTLTFTEAPPLSASIEVISGDTISSFASDASQVNYDQGSTGFASRTVSSKLQEFVSVKDFGAVGDGVTDDTAAIQAALNSGAKTILFKSSDNYLCGSIDVPDGVILQGNSCTITASGSPTEIFKLHSGSASDIRRYVKITDFNLTGTMTYGINATGYEISYCEFRRINISGGTGTAAIRFQNQSTAKGHSANVISDLSILVNNWDHAIHISRDATALSNSVAFDNFDITRINANTEKDCIYVGTPFSHSVIRLVNGGIMSNTAGSEAATGNAHYLVNLDSDVTTAATATRNVTISHVHAESGYVYTGSPAHACVRIKNVSASTIDTIEMIRVAGSAKDNLRAITCLYGFSNKILNFILRDSGQRFTYTGSQVPVEIDANSSDNKIDAVNRSYYAAVSDSGTGNIFNRDKYDKFYKVYNIQRSVSATGTAIADHQILIPGGTLGLNDGIKIQIHGVMLSSSGQNVWSIYWGPNGTSSDTAIATFDTSSTSTERFTALVELHNSSSTSQQYGQSLCVLGSSVHQHSGMSATVDTSADNYLTVIMTTRNGATIYVDHSDFEVIPYTFGA